MTKPFRSNPNHIQLSDAGWHLLPSGVEITRRPLWDDANQLWARMTRGGALAWCETNNCRLPTVDELKELHSASYWIPPVTLVNTPEDKRLMMTIEYAQKHDAKVAELFALELLDMNATVPVANIGKCWEASGGLFGWRRKDGTYIQNGPPTYKGHGDTHLDYSSTQYVVRNPGATIPPESDEAPPKPSTVPPAPPALRKGSKGAWVRKWQQVLLDAGHSLGTWGADGSFGEMTWTATKAWQRGRGLQDDGIVGPMTWAASVTEPTPDTQPAIVTGIDISAWQRPKDMDWPQLAEDHAFCVARACYGTSPDKTFVRHISAARGAGLTVGGYIFYRQQQPWRDQLAAYVAAMDEAKMGRGDMLPVIDLEENQRYDGKLSKRIHNTEGRALVEAVASHYGGVICYAAPHYFVNIGAPSWLLDYPIWCAHYTNKAEPNWKWSDWDIWQWTGKGKTAGYAGAEIDLNRAKRVRLIK